MHFNFFFFFFGRAVALRDLSSLIRDWTWVTAVKAQSPKTGSPGNSLKYIFQTACFSVSKTLMFPRRVSGLRGHRILYHWENRNISPNPCKSNCPLNFMLHKMSEILYAFPEELCLRQTNSRPKVLWAAFLLWKLGSVCGMLCRRQHLMARHFWYFIYSVFMDRVESLSLCRTACPRKQS